MPKHIISPKGAAGDALLVVANPSSRSGKALDRFAEIEALFDEYRIPYAFHYTEPDGSTMTLVARAIADEGFHTVVYIGGDGTFNEVAKGVCASGRAAEVMLGMLPSGTANDQGKSFGIASTARALRKNVEIIAARHTTDLDVGEIVAYSENGVVLRRDLFFDSAGWGLSAAILSFRNHEREMIARVPVVRDMYRDQMVYIRAAVHELALSWLTRDRFDAVVEIDGVVHDLDGLTDLVVSNTPIYAGEWIADPQCLHNDGKFEIVPFRGVRDWTSKLILHHKRVPLTEEMVNRIGISHSQTFVGSQIKATLIKPTRQKRLLSQLDGEEFLPADYFEIVVHKGLLRLIVPENFHWI
ncbi:MAG: diacylglycerol kinase family protein [Myxococcota bacterium]|nr:diacylglycerol kinase family protein [Myxococcota bacterium]